MSKKVSPGQPVLKKKRKRNPQDSTRRNVQAANKRIDALTRRLTARLDAFYLAVAGLSGRVKALERRFDFTPEGK